MKRIAVALALVALAGACKKAGEQPAAQPAADTSKMMADTSKHMMADTTKMAAPAPTNASPRTKRP